MSQPAVLAVVVGVVLALAVGVLALGGVGVSTVSSDGDYAEEIEGTFAEPAPDGSHGLVYSSHQNTSGLSLLGWQIMSPEYSVNVGFVPPAGCPIPESGELRAEGDCADILTPGRISGGGTTSDGRELVIVSVPISEACHDALERWDRWPSDKPECADE